MEGMGGSKTDPGIFINWSLRLGTTASTCITFDKFWPISRDLVFDIRTLELWVVNEVLLKKRKVPKRDFYSTVVMWNRLGKHKAHVKEREYLLEDDRECYFHNSNFRNNSRDCSPVEVHETEQRHFEPSHTSLPGTNPLDDELLFAIKNRLAGVPPMPGGLSLKPEMIGERFNVDYARQNKPPYLVNSEPSKPRKVPTPVATQVDDSMITELKNQGTSTSHVKVTSAFTQSTLNCPRVDGATQSQHCSRTNRVDEEFQRSSHLEQNPHHPERTPSNMNQMNEEDQRSSSPRRQSFPNHARQSVQSQPVPSAHRIIGNMQQSSQPGLPEVPYFYQDRPSVSSGQPPVTSGRPSISRSIRSNQEDWAGNHHMNEVSRRKSTTPQQYQGPQAYPVAQTQPPHRAVRESHSIRSNSPPRVTLDHLYRHPSILSIESPQPQPIHTVQPVHSLQPTHSSSPQPRRAHGSDESRSSPPRVAVDSFGPSIFSIESQLPQPPRTANGSDESPRSSHNRVAVDSFGPSIFSAAQSLPALPPGEQTVLAMSSKHFSNCQMCRCGSRELNLVCFCKKSVVKEVECARLLQEKECRRAKDDCDDFSSKGMKRKKKGKEKKGKLDKEAKAEEKRRKKEEKARLKREKKEARAREKESRKSKRKDKTKSKKGKEKTNGLCSCCKCHGGEQTTVAPSESSMSHFSEDKGKKKSRKEKKRKEKKAKKNKSKERDERPFKSCECPPEPKPYDITRYNSSCRMAPTQGCCNHPESPCPALVSRGLVECSSSSMALPMASSKYNCCDPACPQARRDTHKTCICCKTRDACVERPDPCGRVCATEQNRTEQTGYQGMELRSPSRSRNPDPCGRVCVIEKNRTEQTSYQGMEPRGPSRSRNPGSTRSASTSGNARSSAPRVSTGDAREDGMRYSDTTAAPGIILPNEIGRGDAADALPFPGRWLGDQRFSSAPGYNANDLLIDLSKGGRENSPNKRYVPPCVLYLDCTKVKDLCVIIKDKYEDPS